MRSLSMSSSSVRICGFTTAPLPSSAPWLKSLVNSLNFAEKVERSLRLIREMHREFGDRLVVANSLGKDSGVVWHLAKRVSPDIRGFIVTTRFKPPETKRFMAAEVARHPELRVFSNDQSIPNRLYATDPDRCCALLKVQPTREAIEQMELLGHDFFVFYNSEVDGINVLYRRRSGDYGLLQPELA